MPEIEAKTETETDATSFQATIDEFIQIDENRCEAYADSTGERCRHEPLPGFPYCGDHFHLLDEVDFVRYGVNAVDSGG